MLLGEHLKIMKAVGSLVRKLGRDLQIVTIVGCVLGGHSKVMKAVGSLLGRLEK